MDRWSKWMATRVLSDELEDPSGSGGEGEGSEGSPSGKEKTSPSPQTLSEEQSPFSHPSLKGLTEEQIAERLSAANQAVKSQGQRISRLESDLSQRGEGRGGKEPEPEPETEVSAQSFFENPGKHISEIVGREVDKRLRSTVEPLIRDSHLQRIKTAWDSVASRYGNFGTYRVAVEEKIKEWGVEDPTSQLIEEVYFSVIGRAALEGKIQPEGGEGGGDEGAQRPFNPQHRPSSQPLKTPGEGKQKRREPTEEERHFARVNGMSVEDYLDWQEVDEADVTESKLGVKANA